MSARRSGSVTLALGTAGCVLLNCSNPANAPSEATRHVETKAVALAPPTPALGDFVLYAARSVTLGASDVVSFGNVGVQSAAAPSYGTQLAVGEFSEVDGALFAPSVSVGLNAVVGDVETAALQNNGGFPGSVTPFPIPAMPPFPLAVPGAVGSSNITVPAGQTVTLSPGTYGALDVAGVANLQPGAYAFSSVTVEAQGALFSSIGAVTMSVSGQLVTGQGSLLQGQTADQLTISVSGGDGPAGSPTAASVGPNSQITALLSAPSGTVSLGDMTVATGAFLGFDIAVGARCVVTFQTGFPPNPPGQQGQQQLQGYYGPSPILTIAPLVGPVPPATMVALSVGLSIPNPAELQTFLQGVADPTSSQFRKFVTPTQFAQNYGASPFDYQATITWAQSLGLTVYATYSNNLLLGISGTAAQLEAALYANLVYRQRADGSSFVTVDREPSVDLSVPILRISGLDDYWLPTPAITLNGTSPNPSNWYFAADLRNAYLSGDSGNCASLTGQGQVVGLFELDSFNQTDIAGYDQLQVPPLNPNNVSVPVVQGPPWFVSGPTNNPEVAADIEMVQAMAPNATILVFEGTVGITSHADDLFAAIATTDPPLTSLSNSWNFGRDDNVQQSLNQLAAQGTSVFTISNDYGDVGDPQSDLDMDSQTLVGGTRLSTNPLTSGGAYPANYYAGETTWNDGNPPQSQDVTGGGVMNGINENGQCYCWPYSFLLSSWTCCGSGVPIPGYQVGVDMTLNGGSTQWRNYPDVSLVADDISIFYNNTVQGFIGTSDATPLWAGFAALATERSEANGAGHLGFLNPVIYDIGLTRGTAVDLYSTSFVDINDGANNANGWNSAQLNWIGPGNGNGFTTVAGYDLTTGWGTPTCQLLNQLSSVTPLTPVTLLSQVDILIATGNDDARADSGVTADLTLPDGTVFSVTLKQFGDTSWGDGTVHDLHFLLPEALTEQNGLASMSITLVQNYSFPETADNWDISGLNVRLFNPDSQEACQIDLGSTGTLQDGTPGLVRLSQGAPGSSGSGPTATFSGGSGCATSPSPLPLTSPPGTIQFIIATGGDDLRSDSEAQALLYAAGASSPFQTIELKSQSAGAWANNTLQNLTYALTDSTPIDHIDVNLIEHDGFIQTDDNWNIESMNIMTWNPSDPENCLIELQGDPQYRLTGGGGGTATYVPRSGCP